MKCKHILILVAAVIVIIIGWWFYQISRPSNPSQVTVMDTTISIPDVDHNDGRINETNKRSVGVPVENNDIDMTAQNIISDHMNSKEILTGELQPILFKDHYGILTIEPKPLENAPEKVELRNRVQEGSEYIYKTIRHAVTADGDIPSSLHNVRVMDGGLEIGRVLDFNSVDGTFTWEQTATGMTMVYKGGEIVHMQEASGHILQTKMSPTNEVIELRINGQLIPSSQLQFSNEAPDLWPKEAVRVGTSWDAVASSNKNNTLSNEVIGFFDVQGYKCIGLKTRRIKHVAGSDPQEKVDWKTKITSEVTRYFDFSTGILIREDGIDYLNTGVRHLNSSSDHSQIIREDKPFDRYVRQLVEVRETAKKSENL